MPSEYEQVRGMDQIRRAGQLWFSFSIISLQFPFEFMEQGSLMVLNPFLVSKSLTINFLQRKIFFPSRLLRFVFILGKTIAQPKRNKILLAGSKNGDEHVLILK